MLKNNTEIIHKIIRYTPDTEALCINVEIAAGSIVDNNFVSDGRGLIKHRIVNMPDRDMQQADTLTVDAAGQITLSRMPIDNNPIEIEGTAQNHTSGQVVTCAGYSEGDLVTVKYYYNEPGRNWFDEQALFVKEDHAKYAGMNDHDYNSNRIWYVLLEMGLMSGSIV